MKKCDLPDFPVLDGHTPDTYLEELARHGLDGRLEELRARGARPDRSDYEARLEHELGIIRSKGLSQIALIVWDFMRYTRDRGIPVGPGRGERTCSLVAYALRISGIDPIRHSLIFETFLNPENKVPCLYNVPVFVCTQRCEELASYIASKYGQDRVTPELPIGPTSPGRDSHLSFARAGFVRFEILGIESLTLFEALLSRVNRSRSEKDAIILENIPLDDEATYQVICSKKPPILNLYGLDRITEQQWVHQTWIASRVKPERFEEIVAGISLYRPGPLAAGLATDYINLKRGLHPVGYESIYCGIYYGEISRLLEETCGVLIYHEQMIRIAADVAGFSMGEAANLRRVFGRKNVKQVKRNRKRFAKGALSKSGLEKYDAERLFDYLEHLGGYCIRKSDHVFWALLVYWAAYMMAHHPTEFGTVAAERAKSPSCT